MIRLSSSFEFDAWANVRPVRTVSVTSGRDVETPLTVEFATLPIWVCLMIKVKLNCSSSSLLRRKMKLGTGAVGGRSGSYKKPSARNPKSVSEKHLIQCEYAISSIRLVTYLHIFNRGVIAKVAFCRVSRGGERIWGEVQKNPILRVDNRNMRNGNYKMRFKSVYPLIVSGIQGHPGEKKKKKKTGPGPVGQI